MRILELEVIHKAWEEWLEFKENQEKQPNQSSIRLGRGEKENWKPPEAGTIKIIICAAGDENSSRVGIGTIAKDEKGSMVQAWSVTRDKVSNPVVVKVDAVQSATLFFNKMVVKG